MLSLWMLSFRWAPLSPDHSYSLALYQKERFIQIALGAIALEVAAKWDSQLPESHMITEQSRNHLFNVRQKVWYTVCRGLAAVSADGPSTLSTIDVQRKPGGWGDTKKLKVLRGFSQAYRMSVESPHVVWVHLCRVGPQKHRPKTHSPSMKIVGEFTSSEAPATTTTFGRRWYLPIFLSNLSDVNWTHFFRWKLQWFTHGSNPELSGLDAQIPGSIPIGSDRGRRKKKLQWSTPQFLLEQSSDQTRK